MSNDNFFSDENVPESNWMTFNNVGDIAKWTLVEVINKPAEGNFPAQTVYKLTNASRGSATIVADKVTNPELEECGNLNLASSKSFVNDRLKWAKVGDVIGMAFIKEIPAATKWYAAAKSILPFVWGVDQAYLDSLDNGEGITEEDIPF